MGIVQSSRFKVQRVKGDPRKFFMRQEEARETNLIGKSPAFRLTTLSPFLMFDAN
jgi:hypothetical protein